MKKYVGNMRKYVGSPHYINSGTWKNSELSRSLPPWDLEERNTERSEV